MESLLRKKKFYLCDETLEYKLFEGPKNARAWLYKDTDGTWEVDGYRGMDGSETGEGLEELKEFFRSN